MAIFSALLGLFLEVIGKNYLLILSLDEGQFLIPPDP
jgi:hypothetical protein